MRPNWCLRFVVHFFSLVGTAGTHIKPKAISRMFPCVAKSMKPSRMRRVLRVPYSMRLSSS